MSGVYNRKLFRQTPARDQLKNFGGIMASSPELMQEALQMSSAAPMPSDLGPMQPPAAMQPRPQPTPEAIPFDPASIGQPMGGGMDPMAAPMDQGMDPMAAPMDPMAAPDGYAEGGDVAADDTGMAALAAAGAGGFMPPMDLDPGIMARLAARSNPAAAMPAAGGETSMPEYDALGNPLGTVDITAPAGTVAPPVSVDPAVAETAATIAETADQEAPEDTAQKIIDNVGPQVGVEPGQDQQSTLANILARMTGDLSGYEKNIDELNKGIIGAAIAAGTSARATQNIANGLLVGLQGAQQTEERRAQAAQALELAVAQASGKSKSGAGSQNYDSPIDAYLKIYSGVVNQGVDNVDLPEGVSLEDYAKEQAEKIISSIYTPEQLVGTRLEGLHERIGGGASPAAAAAPQDAETEAVLEQARAALSAGKSRAAIEERLRSMGIDPGLL